MKIKIILIATAILLMTGLCGAENLYSRNFEWEPFKAGSFALNPPKWEDTSGQDDFLESRNDHFPPNGTGNGKNDPGGAREFELALRHFKFSISRYGFNPDYDRSVTPLSRERQRERLINSFPSVLSNSSNQERFETIGKIFEPNLNLRIEF